MKKSIKKLISLALVMTMLLSTMMVVSAEGTIAVEDVSFEEELMPMAATNCNATSTIGFSGDSYRFSGSSYVTLYIEGSPKSNYRNSESDNFKNQIQIMDGVYRSVLGSEILLWQLVKGSVPTSASLRAYGINENRIDDYLRWYYAEQSAISSYDSF